MRTRTSFSGRRYRRDPARFAGMVRPDLDAGLDHDLNVSLQPTVRPGDARGQWRALGITGMVVLGL